MKLTLRKSVIPGFIQKHFPQAKLRDVAVVEYETDAATARHFLVLVRKAHRGDCILIPPGVYPAPEVHRSIVLRALRPGTVRFEGKPGEPVLKISHGEPVWISGIEFQPAKDQISLVLERGNVLLTECSLRGGVDVRGKDSVALFQGSSVSHATTGVDLSGGSRAEMTSSSVTGCQVGINAAAESRLALFHSRVESSMGPSANEPGAGLHAEKSSVYLFGSSFSENQIGVHLVDCQPTEILSCLFEKNALSGLIVAGGGDVRVHGSTFSDQATTSYGQITLENVNARIEWSEFDQSAPPIQSVGGKVEQIERSAPVVAFEPEDAFASVLNEIRSIIGYQDAKPVLENILHQAHASMKRSEQGLPVLPQKFHLIFEGSEGTGRRYIAELFGRAMASLGILSHEKVTEVHMEELMMGGPSLTQTMNAAEGGILMLHTARDLDRRDPRLSFSRARDVVQTMIAACGEQTILIFAGERELIRPVLRGASDASQLFRDTIRFPLPSPPEMAQTFARLCADHQIRLTTRAVTKILLIMHMLDDRRDRRFSNSSGIMKLFEITHKRYLERCSRERNFSMDLESGDLDSPVEKSVELIMAGQPAFVSICPVCLTDNAWQPHLPEHRRCLCCDHEWTDSWGIWTGSSFYRRLTSPEEVISTQGIPISRRRVAGVA